MDVEEWFEACEDGDLLKIENFIKLGVDINVGKNDTRGSTALSRVVMWGFIDVIKLLLHPQIEGVVGADINAQNKDGRTALMCAVRSDYNLHIVELLLHPQIEGVVGSDVNIKDKNGNTALMLAVTSWQPHNVELLLKYGADMEIKNNDGDTFLDFAKGFELETINRIIFEVCSKNIKGVQ